MGWYGVLELVGQMRRRHPQHVASLGPHRYRTHGLAPNGPDMIDRRRQDDQQNSAQPDRREGEAGRLGQSFRPLPRRGRGVSEPRPKCPVNCAGGESWWSTACACSLAPRRPECAFRSAVVSQFDCGKRRPRPSLLPQPSSLNLRFSRRSRCSR